MRIVLLAVLMSLTACGFHLREQAVLPTVLQELRIEVADPFSPIGQELGRRITSGGPWA